MKNRKIAFVINSLGGGGAEHVLITLTEELLTFNYDISIIIFEKRIAYELNKSVDLFLIPDNKLKNRFFRIWTRILNIRRILKKIKPDIIIPFTTNVSINTFFATIGMTTPLIASEHSVFYSRGIINDKIRKFVFKRLDHIICLNQFDFKQISKINPNTSIIYNPCPYNVVAERQEEKLSPFAICVGSIERYEDKGIDKLIMIWSQIITSCPDLHLYIFGKGSEKNMNVLRKLINDLNMTDKVFLKGFHKDLASWYEKSTMLISTSKIECLPMNIIEAQTLGCPVIAFNCPYGPAELITHGYDGLLVSNQDYNEMKKTIINLYRNPILRQKISRNSIISQKRFNKKVIASQWDLLIKSIISQKRNVKKLFQSN
ncbi:Probable poly(glycerol-phosphate) alpha-glucosyltransferase [Porphyromonas macacae]|uniref:Probable poly(Glycerol-phosphate) alpha-glucosyltransferase n=1 Tax=Porphyromonas macacae TaxID=28115 RepID=A0A379E6S3_9PORP|nr:glycosyltransferase [Porphyromonas macacae]SUB88417.1 Probable poly(glycerol-phosphate) alpha-glucosyltransferase [Porphyromonas macacae]